VFELIVEDWVNFLVCRFLLFVDAVLLDKAFAYGMASLLYLLHRNQFKSILTSQCFHQQLKIIIIRMLKNLPFKFIPVTNLLPDVLTQEEIVKPMV
jgi:hypothetical protein